MADAGGKNNTLTYRVGQLEILVGKLDDKLDNLLTNEMPHMCAEITALKTRVNVLTAVNIGALILAIIISKFL